MIQNGKNLSMHNGAIWKGTYTNNGMLLKLHENSYTIGYSALLSPDGTSAGKVKFGDGVFYDAQQKNNKVYAGAPTVTDAVPVFAGIVVREAGIASGYPAINDEVADFQKGMIAKEGYIEYKEAYVVLMVSASNGAVYFAQTASAKVSASDVLVGKIASMNPDDKTVTVYISPAINA